MGLLLRIRALALVLGRGAARGGPFLRRAGWVLVGLGLAAYLVFVTSRMGLCAGGSDSSGYVNGARILREGRLVAEQRQLEGVAVPLPDFTYVPLGFVPVAREPGGRGAPPMSPSYPLGLPALFVAPSCGGSLEAGMHVAMTLMLVGSLVVTYRLGRLLGLEPVWALVGVGMLAGCPLFLGLSVQTMSDMPALFWTTLALVLALESRRRRWMAGAAGVAVAIAVFVRPANALVVLPLVWALGLDWRRWLWLGLAGLPGAVLWALMNKVLFGHYIATGYGDVSRLFGWHNVLPTLRNYGETCARILPLGVLAALATTRGGRGADPRATAAAATWVVLVGGFYCFYQHTQEVWWYLRFVLPAFPALIVLAVGGLRQVHGWLAGPGHVWRLGLAGAVVVTLLGWQLARQVRACEEWWVLWWGEGELRYVELCRRLETHAPANAVVFAMQTSGALFSLQPWVVVRRDCMTPELSRELYAAAGRAGRPVFAALFPFELAEGCFGKNLAGRWVKIDAVDDKTLWRLDDPAGAMPTVAVP